MPRQHVPSYRFHTARNQAVVTIAGRDHSLGRYGSASSRQKYDRLISEWLERGRVPEPAPFQMRSRSRQVRLRSVHSLRNARRLVGHTGRD